MNNLFSKISKAVDAFTDILTEDVSSIKKTELYKYSDFVSFVSQMRKNNPNVSKCTVSVNVKNEFNGIVYPEVKYIVRIVLLDKNGSPLRFDDNDEAYIGTVIIAASIDTKMNEFMNGKTVRTVRLMRGEK